METLYLTHPACKLHDMGDWHPESPQRLDAINDQLLASGLEAYLSPRDAPRADRAALARVHSPDYLAQLLDGPAIDGTRTLDPDTLQGPYTAEAALHAAGAGLAAVDAVLTGQAQSAFCSVRPPGHHACRTRAMGFCFLNNVAIAARHALDVHHLSRVAIIDFDVHHGNGTEDILAGDERVLMCSFFQSPFFPHCGTENVADNMVNVPVPAYTTGAAVRELVSRRWLPRLEAFRPELLIFSAGFDAHREDEMGQMGLVEADYAWLTKQVMHVADRHARGRAISMLEGGYDLSALGRSVVAHVRALAKL